MKEKIYTKKDKLIIEIPLFSTRSEIYGNPPTKMENIVGLIYHSDELSDPEVGFCYNIDMSYKGKADQETSFFFQYYDGRKEFIKLCKKLKIELRESFI